MDNRRRSRDWRPRSHLARFLGRRQQRPVSQRRGHPPGNRFQSQSATSLRRATRRKAVSTGRTAQRGDERHRPRSPSPRRSVREPGGAFSIFGDYIIGWQLELVPNQRIVQAWRETSWDPGHLFRRALPTRPAGFRHKARFRPHRLSRGQWRAPRHRLEGPLLGASGEVSCLTKALKPPKPSTGHLLSHSVWAIPGGTKSIERSAATPSHPSPPNTIKLPAPYGALDVTQPRRNHLATRPHSSRPQRPSARPTRNLDAHATKAPTLGTLSRSSAISSAASVPIGFLGPA